MQADGRRCGTATEKSGGAQHGAARAELRRSCVAGIENDGKGAAWLRWSRDEQSHGCAAEDRDVRVQGKRETDKIR